MVSCAGCSSSTKRRSAASTAQDFPAEQVKSSAGIIRRFIEDYHERLEEEFVFPRFEKAGKLMDLVTVLRTQHQAGRALTDRIVRLTGGR